MARKRTLILLKTQGTAHTPLGRRNDVIAAMSRSNIAPDGSGPEGLGERLGSAVLYGPGMIVELPVASPDAEVLQALLTLTDEDFAWPVVMRLTKDNGWKMMDPESGRTFGG